MPQAQVAPIDWESNSEDNSFEVVDDDDDEDDQGNWKSKALVDIATKKLPSKQELSRELCTIVFGSGSKPHSQNNRWALHSLTKLAGWVQRRDPVFMKHVLIYRGVAKVMDFHQEIARKEEDQSQDESSGGEKLRGDALDAGKLKRLDNPE